MTIYQVFYCAIIIFIVFIFISTFVNDWNLFSAKAASTNSSDVSDEIPPPNEIDVKNVEINDIQEPKEEL